MPVSGDDESTNTSIEAEQRFELLYYGEADLTLEVLSAD
jgi:hypothetical protein